MSQIAISAIRRDGGTQSRDDVNEDVVEGYAEHLREGGKFPPVMLVFDGTDYWLADGFQRVAAHELAGLAEINAQVVQGTRRDAVLKSCGANATHGLPRTNADKRRAVCVLLSDHEWSTWSDNKIATSCGVSQPFVAKVRASILQTVGSMDGDDAAPETRTSVARTFIHHKTGQPATMNVGAIGKSLPRAGVATTVSNIQPGADDAGEGDGSEDDAHDLMRDLEESMKENADLRHMVEKLSASDVGAELVKLERKYAGLEGRLHLEMATSRQAQKEAQNAKRLLRQVREALGVTSNTQVLTRIGDLKRSKAA